jgi:hypothetical protein
VTLEEDVQVPQWREVQGGWAITLAPGESATIQVSKRGVCHWNYLLTGVADSIVQAQTELEKRARLMEEARPK